MLSLQTWLQQLLHKAAGVCVGREDAERLWRDVSIDLFTATVSTWQQTPQTINWTNVNFFIHWTLCFWGWRSAQQLGLWESTNRWRCESSLSFDVSIGMYDLGPDVIPIPAEPWWLNKNGTLQHLCWLIIDNFINFINWTLCFCLQTEKQTSHKTWQQEGL